MTPVLTVGAEDMIVYVRYHGLGGFLFFFDMHIWALTTLPNDLQRSRCSKRPRIASFTVMLYEYCGKNVLSTLVLMQACVASQNDAV